MKRCDECAYFELSNNFPSYEHKGYCRRFPPVRDEWSIVGAFDQCGEFSAKVEHAHYDLHDAMGRATGKDPNVFRQYIDGGISM